MNKSNLIWAFTTALCMSGSIFTACSDNDLTDNGNNGNDGEENKEGTSYVIAATAKEGVSYLLTAASLDEGTVTTQYAGEEVIGGTYWVFKDQDYLFALVYNKGGNGTGASYYLNAYGKPTEKYAYEFNRITTYGTWGDHVITASTGNAPQSQADPDGNLPQVLLFNYLSSTDGSQTESSVLAENFLGNGEKVHFSGIVEANNKLYTSVIPGGMSKYAIHQWPQLVSDPQLIATQDGGSASSSYEKGEIPSTQYPDSAFIAIYSGDSFNQTPVIARTGKIGYACGRMRSQYYQTIWAADNGDIYAFSPGYGRTALPTDELKKVTGKKPSGVVRIKAGETTFDESYYVNLEEIGTRHPVYRCWHIDEDYFLLQLYKGGAEGMIKDGKSADVSELAIFKGEDKTIIPVTGIPSDLAGFSGEPYGENGNAYIAVTVTGGSYPAFYKIDVRTGVATKGLTVVADGISGVGKLAVQK